jgi:hypothetical protein
MSVKECVTKCERPVRPRDMKREPRMVMTAVREIPTLDWISSIFLHQKISVEFSVFVSYFDMKTGKALKTSLNFLFT